MVQTVVFTLAGLVGSTVWLSLLVVSGFSRAVLGVGLLAMLALIGDRTGTRS